MVISIIVLLLFWVLIISPLVIVPSAPNSEPKNPLEPEPANEADGGWP